MTGRTIVRGAAIVVLFVLAATLNSGGYRYGAADQAFYIPAILDTLHPELFPRDGALIAPQAKYFFIDEIVAGGMRAIGGSIETWFLAGYLLSLVVLALALTALGRTVFSSPLAVTALLAIYTLKHRIAKTGVNTLEGYFHPRVLVFAAGVAALVLFLRGRPWLALALVCVTGFLHPTTAAFFVLVIGVATWATVPGARRPLTIAAAAGALGIAWLVLLGPWREALAPMDAEWRQLLASKDYLFPIEVWPLSAWLINLGTAAVAIVGLLARQRASAAQSLEGGLVSPTRLREGGPVSTKRRREGGLLAGAIALLALFIVTAPLVQYGATLMVQLQISRVFWLLELLALIPVVWWLVDRPAASGPTGRRVAIGVTAILVAASAARGIYVAFVERDTPVFQASLPQSDWSNAMRWIATHTPPTAHVLTDPGHAYLYGYPVRFAGRDVYLEAVKDTAMALYNRAAAERVIVRLRDLGDFSTLTSNHAWHLAEQYQLDYLVTTHPMDMVQVALCGRFRIYQFRYPRFAESPSASCDQ